MKVNLIGMLAATLLFGSAVSLHAAWQAGLQGGTVSSTSLNTTAYPAVTNFYMGPHAGKTTASPPWAANTTWVYWGQIYLEATQIWFAENIDDAAHMRIWNGSTPTTLLNNSVWNVPTAGSFTAPAAGWYPVEIRLWNSGSLAGPAAGSGWTSTHGFGYKVGGASSTSGSDYTYPEDNGGMSLFRYDDGFGFADILQVQGFPANYGSPVPPYGHNAGYASNDTVASSVDLNWTNTAVTISAHCTGWKVFCQTNQEHEIWVETTNGLGNAFTYTHGGDAGRVEWQFDADYKVVFTSAVAPCTVVAANGWYAHDTVVTATASNAPGYVFSHWAGEGIPEAFRQNPEITFALTGPVAATATYDNLWYVKEGGDDANSGRSWEDAFATIQHAIDQAVAGEAIHVGSGSYNSTGGVEVVRLDKPVTIIGVNGPASTFLDPMYGMATHPPRRAVTVTAAGTGALLAGFTFTNGYSTAKASPRILLADGFVTASNCVFRKSYNAPWAAAHVHINKGCRITDCLFDGTGDVHSSSEGAGVLLTVATVPDYALIERCGFVNYDMTSPNFALIRLGTRSILRNSLVAGNQTGGGVAGIAATPSGVIALSGSTVEIDGCTIVGNHTRSSCGGGGIVAGTTSYTVRNTVLWGNTSVSGLFQDLHITTGTYASHLNLFYNSCGTFLEDGVNGNLASAPYFTDFAGADYTLSAVSPCRDAAAARDWHANALDRAGQPRVRGSAADIGAFEADPILPSELAVAAVYTPSVLPLPAVAGEPVTFNAAAAGPDLTGLSFAWDFGHDATTGSGASAQHSFPDAGTYTVTCTANAGSDSAEATLTLMIAPALAYVATDGSDTPPYDTWERATPDLAAAAETGAREVLIGNGEFQLPKVSSIFLARPLHVHSVNGPAHTTIKAYTSGNARHFDVAHSEARLTGLRLTKGRTADYDFPAALEITDGVVSNCVVEEVAAVNRSSFVRVAGTGRLVDSVIRGRAASGGNRDGHCAALHITGAGLVDRCIVSQYLGYAYVRDGVNLGQAHSAVLMDSSTATLRNTLVLDCTNTYTFTAGVLTTNCFGAGLTLRNGRVENCTFARNVGAIDGAAIAVRVPGTASRTTTLPGAIIRNCAFFGNVALNGGFNDIFQYHAAGEISNNCSPELEDGVNGNIAAMPTFKSGTWIPASGSPLVGTAATLDWMTSEALDLAGQPRVFGRAPDIGAYERTIAAGTYLLVR